MLLKCQKAAVRRKYETRNLDLFSAFEILDNTGSSFFDSVPRGAWNSRQVST